MATWAEASERLDALNMRKDASKEARDELSRWYYVSRYGGWYTLGKKGDSSTAFYERENPIANRLTGDRGYPTAAAAWEQAARIHKG